MNPLLVKAGIALAPAFLAAASPVIEKIGQGVENIIEAGSDRIANNIRHGGSQSSPS